ncbi:MAG: DUF3097 family protein [Actinomycetaceae bacterium]|nr:DUF3097 family protein [Actinomycetaceae bacterium]
MFLPPHRNQEPEPVETPANPGLVVEDVETGWVGAIKRCEKSGGMFIVELEDRHGAVRSFPLGPGFWIEGKPVILTPPEVGFRRDVSLVSDSYLLGHGGRRVSASGSFIAEGGADGAARVAKAARLWVEGVHDADLVQKIWGDDLGLEGIAVELLDGADHLEAVLAEFEPRPERRAGVLLDHLVPGSKESRLADAMRGRYGLDSLLIVGHPFVDIWQAVKPGVVVPGMTAWPDVPRDVDIKVGTCRALGWPCETKEDLGLAWKRILSGVNTYRDIEPTLMGRVEELIDFLTV